MPELPEVETIRRQLHPTLLGRQVVASGSHPSEKFVEATHALGAGLEATRRRGKYLLIELDDDRELIVHLGMTGQLTVQQAPDLDDYVRAWWRLDDGATLVYRDVRRFGRIRVVPRGDYASIATLAKLGPEPSDDDFTPTQLHQALRQSNRRIKTQLLSQRPVAGLGNIYADEALWRSRIYPAARQISQPAAARLHRAIIEVLEAAINNGGTTLRDYRDASGGMGSNQFHLDCYGRGGEPCVRCGVLLKSRVWDARTTTWCPTCQTR